MPQLNTNSSSIEFLDVSQVEFVRGPQSALFGRNTLGGLINISSARPSLSEMDRQRRRAVRQLRVVRRARATPSGPIGRQGRRSASPFGHAQRDGFTVNDITGNDLDSRDATFGKAQLLLDADGANWETRLIVHRRARARRRLRA